MKISSVEIGLAVFFVGAGLVWSWFAMQKSERQARAKFRSRAHAQFKNSAVASADERYAFSGHSVSIVTELERRQTVEGYTVDIILERYCMNDRGEYFHFISNSAGRPYVRHVPHRMARLVLKQNYLPPPSDPC
ncbi:hypothetical protein J2X20_005467 [Pelomonas saccharophila]|uniref:DUF3592 domain-containing protein n=1 Tax=Roseateles saccharophilus TaxID=304 RepID=A0ABU1YV89_ROSSA|nr:hypothetical protein [Roseateles saccharophilus]MDR7272784.1 hypothetical protein [Roseateles saccharophilus]